MSLATFFDGNNTPAYLQPVTDPRRPPREDMSWRVEDWDTGHTVDEYHPHKPRHTPTKDAPCRD